VEPRNATAREADIADEGGMMRTIVVVTLLVTALTAHAELHEGVPALIVPVGDAAVDIDVPDGLPVLPGDALAYELMVDYPADRFADLQLLDTNVDTECAVASSTHRAGARLRFTLIVLCLNGAPLVSVVATLSYRPVASYAVLLRAQKCTLVVGTGVTCQRSHRALINSW
jgi:hypothetical protein